MKFLFLTIKKSIKLLFFIWLFWNIWIFSEIVWWKFYNPKGLTSLTAQREKERLAQHKIPYIHYPWISYSHISNSLKRAVVAEEDANFINHSGFDWRGIKVAFQKDINKKTVIAGGSTITQQLAKNLFLSPRRNLFRKAEEAIITVMLETVWDKRRILEVYLNVIEWGDGIYGCESAARHYFGVTVSAVTPSQAALLASMIPKPKYYDRFGTTEKLLDKSQLIQQRMNQVLIPK